MPGTDGSHNHRRLRPLAPAPTAPAPGPPVASASVTARRRQSTVSAACVECRRQKTRCSGDRPTCRRCALRHIDCEYTTRPGETESHALKEKFRSLQEQSVAHEEVFELLKTLPHHESQDVLRSIRSGMDAAAILRRFKTGDALLQMALSPETRFRYTFPYKTSLKDVLLASNPYLDSIVYEASGLFSPEQASSNGEGSDSGNSAAASVPKKHQSLYLKPFHAAEVIDPQLTSADISAWTTVCSDNALMRDILSKFLRCEFQYIAAFQKDLFLEDLALRRDEFCSSLLVNAVLGYACVCYSKFSKRAEYWNPDTLVYQFVSEAKRLWDLESDVPRVTTIQAGIIFTIFHNLCGLDEIGQLYRLHTIDLTCRLRLFHADVGGRSRRTCHGLAFAAWAVYNWETLVAFSFLLPPLLEKQPEWPLPNATQDAFWYGEIWVKYPLSNHLSSQYFGKLLEVRTNFHVIMNEACRIQNSKGSEMEMDKAYEILGKLQAWYESLPGPLQPRAIVLPAQLRLHMYYYHLILTIFSPFIGVKTAPEPLPEQIVAEAHRNLLTLVRLYYLRHGFEAMDLFIVIPLMMSASECIDMISEQNPTGPALEELRATLMLAVKGLYDQRRNHYLAEVLYRVIRGRMRPAEVVLMRDMIDLEDESAERHELMQKVRSRWPVSVVKKKEEMEAKVLTNLVESYAHLNVGDGQHEGDPPPAAG